VVVAIIVIKLPKMIQVSDELYEALVLGKAELMLETKKEETFHNVVAMYANGRNHLRQILSHLVRKYPDVRPKLEKTAKALGYYDEIKGIIGITGVKKEE